MGFVPNIRGTAHRLLEGNNHTTSGGVERSDENENESFLMLLTVIVALICLFYTLCTYQLIRQWLCRRLYRDAAPDPDSTVLVHEGQVFNLTGDQRRAVLEAIFSETSKAVTDSDVTKKKRKRIDELPGVPHNVAFANLSPTGTESSCTVISPQSQADGGRFISGTKSDDHGEESQRMKCVHVGLLETSNRNDTDTIQKSSNHDDKGDQYDNTDSAFKDEHLAFMSTERGLDEHSTDDSDVLSDIHDSFAETWNFPRTPTCSTDTLVPSNTPTEIHLDTGLPKISKEPKDAIQTMYGSAATPVRNNLTKESICPDDESVQSQSSHDPQTLILPNLLTDYKDVVLSRGTFDGAGLNVLTEMSDDVNFREKKILNEEHEGKSLVPVSVSRRNSFGTVASEYTFDDDSTVDNVCPICLCGYKKGDVLIVSKYCTHMFHKDCILEWLEKHDDCPICRVGMVTDSEMSRAATSLVGKTRMFRAVASMQNVRPLPPPRSAAHMPPRPGHGPLERTMRRAAASRGSSL